MLPRVCANCRATLAASAVHCAHCALTVGDEWSKWRGHRSESANTAEADEVMAELKEVLAPSIEIMSPLGAGGMGLVYLAHDIVLKRLVAVKVLSPSFASEDTARERFRREVEAIAAITHPHVVSIYQVGELPRLGAPYFLMQYVEGTTLRAEVPPGEIVPEAKVRRIIGEVAMALSAAHVRGLVHRDIKPANIMLERESGRALVVDFGISATVTTSRRGTEPRLSTQGMFVGTPSYMSPEQASGLEITQASDIYSLGIVAFELLTGRLPFTGHSTAEIMAGHGSDDPAPLIRTLRPDLHPQLGELIDRALRKNPAERPSADEIARLLFASSRSYIEWPPPGLGQLRALGARLSETLGIAEGIGLMFFLLLMLQPAIASLRWHERETSAFWNVVLLPNAMLRGMFEGSGTAEQVAVDAAPIWGFLLTLCLTVMLVCFPFIIGRALHLAYRVRWARRSGYPWKVIIAVAWDYRRDTVALLNGTGIYALLSRRERRRLIRLRWMEQSAGAIGVLLGALTPLIWFITASRRASPADGRLLSPNEALFVIAPPLIALLVLTICKRPEARHRTRMQRQRVFMTRQVTPLVRPELVSTWLRSVRLPTTPRARVPGAATAAVPILMIIVATGVVAGLFLSALPTIVATTAFRRPAVEWVQSFQTDSLRPIPWQAIRASLPRFTGGYGGPPDSAVAALLRLSSRRVTGTDSGRSSPATTRLARILARPRLLLSEAEIERLSAEGRGEDVEAWRATARSGPFISDSRFWTHTLNDRRPYEFTRPGSVLREVAAINAAHAILDWQNADRAGSRDRLDENLALAGELVRAPFPGWQTVGLDVLRDARAVERAIGNAIGETRLVAADTASQRTNVDAVLLTARAHRSFFDRGRQRLLMADPVSPPGLRFVGDTTLSPADRWALTGAALTGFCDNTREVLFGIDRRRSALIDASVQALRDIPGSDAWGRLHRQWLADGLPVPPDVSSSGQRVQTRGVLGFPSRLRFCTTQLPRLTHEAR